MTARLLIGDVFERLAELEDGSVDLVVTSPPFLALRSYLPADHPDKGKEIGSEATPAAFLDTLLALTVEWRRVLAPHGSICIELGDTYANDNGGRTSPEAAAWLGKKSQPGTLAGVQRLGAGWPLDKSLSCIPTLYTASLAYGRNLLNPVHTIEPWRIRNVITWLRPNPPVGALGDKFRPATSFITVACTGRQRYFDLDAVREPAKSEYQPTVLKKNTKTGGFQDGRGTHGNVVRSSGMVVASNPAGAPPLDWHSDLDGGNGSLILATQPYAGAHYATFPAKLPQRLIEAMCPTRVCRQCGKPSERIVDHQREMHAIQTVADSERQIAAHGKSLNNFAAANGGAGYTVTRETLGWSDCGHDDWRAGLVLDCFGGSGTTGAVATGLGRDCLLIDIDDRNIDLARDRIGMFLEVDEGVVI